MRAKIRINGIFERVESLDDALDIVERECGYDLREYIEDNMIDRKLAGYDSVSYEQCRYFE
ncbi:hypothetical protein [Butyricicoccus intestinisimiae]|uniref:Protein dpnD n=1 Tax=Butyricicoccus intestinisimiae TaxID=2841509 RepID=A0ABS6EWY3_9FIRM|nr:hypothetical protein [Butyricicoccus intestinisimiae]MBU5491334.1 hypothetical protein [Butyricicoccus intestinisimiae]